MIDLLKNLKMKKKPKLPTDLGEFRVFHYDEKDDVVEASSLIFPTRGAAEQFMRDNVNPALDPYVASASKKEAKTNGNQEGENPYGGAV
jgi:hypothetical protein